MLDVPCLGAVGSGEPQPAILSNRAEVVGDVRACKDALTHNNGELCSHGDLKPGLDVLLQAVLARADRRDWSQVQATVGRAAGAVRRARSGS